MTKSLGRRLTVLQIVPWLHGGGVERGTLEVAKALVDTGHRSLVASGGGALVEQLEDEGSEHFDLEVGRKSLRSLSHIGTLKRLWQDALGRYCARAIAPAGMVELPGLAKFTGKGAPAIRHDRAWRVLRQSIQRRDAPR